MKTKRKQSSVDVSLKIRYILGTKNRRRGKKKDVLSTGKCDYPVYQAEKFLTELRAYENRTIQSWRLFW